MNRGRTEKDSTICRRSPAENVNDSGEPAAGAPLTVTSSAKDGTRTVRVKG